MRYVANIFLALMLIFTVILMPNYSFSLEFQETEDSISCCKSEGGAENYCQNSSNEHKECGGDCYRNCCCFKIVLKSEKQNQIEVEVFQNHTKPLDMYSRKYKYSFCSNIYKPPIHFISFKRNALI